ncbi:MAG TPA: hypothetical protein VIM41_10835 [Gammaproteobacteria bacterium]
MPTRPENNIISGSNSPSASVSRLAKSALWGFCLNSNEHIVATHQELAVLRRCATLACSKPGQIVHVIARGKAQHTQFIVNTLRHFGVSCGQIQVRAAAQNEITADGIWLFVENRQAVC